MHLGLIEEKFGKSDEALATYELALGSLPALQRNIFPDNLDPDAESLRKHIDRLRQKGINIRPADSHNAEQKLRAVHLGDVSDTNLRAQYTVIFSDGKLVEIAPAGYSPVADENSGDAIVRRADFSTWSLPHSAARLLRKGTLNCHSGSCEFVVNPL